MKIYDLPVLIPSATTTPEAPQAARSFDPASITETIERALSAAGLNTASGPMKGVTDTIRQALSAAGLTQDTKTTGPQTIDAVAREIADAHDEVGHTSAPPIDPVEPARPGQFVNRTFANAAGTRTYKLYVPSGYSSEASEPMPLVVMLHGCTQSPDDFAAGTRMNDLAEQHGFLVAYPAQSANANGGRCWNWFRTEDQRRERGEPSLIAGITREVASSYRVDERRIFVAGMSAGAAMAVVLGVAYPELYAAVGAHSGLAYGFASDTPSALRAMQGAGSGATASNSQIKSGVPTIVFHGDLDHTVSPLNAQAIVDQAIAGRDDAGLRRIVQEGTAAGGRSFTRTIFADAANQPVVEQWVVHGAGHAWAGGGPKGSFTDATGPDASAEMIRFFHSQVRAGSA